MFCPQCKTEYRSGFTMCADCRVPLVSVLPPDIPRDEQESDPDVRFVKLLGTCDPTDIAQIRAVLDSAEIRYFIQGENLLSLRGVDPAVVLVVEEDAARAAELLEPLKLNYARLFPSGFGKSGENTA